MKTLVQTFQFGLSSNPNDFRNKYICIIKKENEEVYITFERLYEKATQILYYLQIKNIEPGEEVIIELNDNEIFLYLFWACILGGIIPVPISMSSNSEHKLKLFKIWPVLSKPHLITTAKSFGEIEEFAHKMGDKDALAQEIKKGTIFIEDIDYSTAGIVNEAKPNDIAFIQFSSGSTGDPKGVVLTHKNLLTNIQAIIKCSQITLNDKTLSWMPLTHDMGLIGFHLVPFFAGINQFIIPTSLFIRRPTLWMDKVSEHKATLLSSPNFGYQYFLSFLKPNPLMNWDLSAVRLIYNGAEPISSELCKRFITEMEKYRLQKNVIYPVYGMAEASLAVTFPPPGKELICFHLSRENLNIGDRVKDLDTESLGIPFVDVGFPVENCFIRICDETSNVLEDNYIGYIQIKGENVTPGYYNNSQASETVILKDGWLITGDLGFMRNGRLVVTGRVKDIIFVHGQNYYSHDIERVAQEVEGVELGEVVACGITNEEDQKSEDIVLFILFKKEVEKFVPIVTNTKKYIQKFMGLEIKYVIPVKKISKTTSGKLMRFRLKERFEAGEFFPVIGEINELLAKDESQKNGDEPVSNIEERLIQIWSELLGTPIGKDENFLEVGGNSLLLSRFCAQIENENIGKVSLVDLFSYPSIQKLAGFFSGDLDKSVDQITFLQLKLPGEYFQVEAGDFESANDNAYVFRITGTLFEKIISISEKEYIQPEDLLLAAFGNCLYEIAEQDEITIQTMTKNENQVDMVGVDFKIIDTLSTLFKLYHEKRNGNENQSYPLAAVHNLTIHKERYSIIPFFYDQSLLTIKNNLLSMYDISLGVTKTDDALNLVFEYNYRLLKGKKMREFFRTYIKMIYATNQNS